MTQILGLTKGGVARAIGALATVLALAPTGLAASSFSNSLTGFTGDSTQTATQNAFTAAGFSVFTTDGYFDNGTPEDPGDDADPTIVFDSAGVHFGSLIAGDPGRNYMRTTIEDFATTSFTAEITFVAPDLANQDTFFGLGAGDTALFGFPDWSTLFSSVLVLPEIDNENVSKLTTFRTQDDINEFAATNTPTMGNGTHRLRLAFDIEAMTATFSVDVDYAGGAYTADVTATPVDVSTLYGDFGWPGEPSRIYFGGDDGVIFKDLSIVVGGGEETGDFDGNTIVDGGDLLAWQQGLGITNGAQQSQGDGNGDGKVDAADLAIWSGQYGQGYATPVAGAVPEPATAVLLLLGLGALGSARRR